jgi:hypothetical protein
MYNEPNNRMSTWFAHLAPETSDVLSGQRVITGVDGSTAGPP